MRFGPHSRVVESLRRELGSYRWFENLGHPHTEDTNLRRVDFTFMVENEGFEYGPWGSLLSTHESRAERLVLDNARLAAQDAMVEQFSLRDIVPFQVQDDLLFNLDEAFTPDGSYYPGTFTYPHEYVSLPDRLVRGAGLELVVSDLDSSLKFFQHLLPWLRDGYWPAGWEGEWPHGRLILW